VIFALGIMNVGEELGNLLAEHYNSLDALAAAREEDLMQIPSIGPRIAESIVAFFRQEQNRKVIEKLRKAGVRLEAEVTKKRDLPLSGMEFVVTGRLESFSRPEAESRIRELGGKAGSDITRKTSYLVVGADPGSKLARAQSLGTKIIDEAEFKKLLENKG
jgi:DNA ligase (NAD+)